MKKLFFAILALATLTFASCEKEPIGGTATQEMAGQWYTTIQHIDKDGSVMYDGEDLFGIGQFWTLTYNTAADKAEEMWISDVDGAFWEYQVKVKCNISDKSFTVTEGEDILNGALVTITNGKILPSAAKTPSGMKADSIVFDILFSDDPYAYGAGGPYYDHLRVTGYRYTGLAADD